MTDKGNRHESWFGDQNRSWIPGLILILIGGFFLLRNYTGLELDNWWALFILFPAANSLSSAYQRYREAGSFDRQARSSAFWGLFFVALAASFLFSLPMGTFWPVFLILGGVAMLFGAL